MNEQIHSVSEMQELLRRTDAHWARCSEELYKRFPQLRTPREIVPKKSIESNPSENVAQNY